MASVIYLALKKPYHVKVERDPQMLDPLKAAILGMGALVEFVNRDGLYVLVSNATVLDALKSQSFSEEVNALLKLFNKRPVLFDKTYSTADTKNSLNSGTCSEGLVLLDIFERTPTLFARIAHKRLYPESLLLFRGEEHAKLIHVLDDSASDLGDYFGPAKRGIRYPIVGTFPSALYPVFKDSPVFFHAWLRECFRVNAYPNPLNMGDPVGVLTWEAYRNIFFGNGEGAALQNMLRGPQFQNVTPAILRGSSYPALTWTF